MKTSLKLMLALAAAVMSPSVMAEDEGLSKTGLRKLFENTQWTTSEKTGGDVRSFVFLKFGEVSDSFAGGGKFKFFTVEPPDILKVYRQDPKKDRKAEFMLFRVDAAAKTATQDVKASTAGGSMSLKYQGPAKPGK
jgi:hypothetical protein